MTDYQLSSQQRDRLLQELSTLLKERVTLQQALREQQESATAANEQLFLELLDLFDTLDFFLNYLNENPEPNPQSWKSLLKSFGSLQNRLLAILSKRDVRPIDFHQSEPDFNLCRVVDREVRNDLDNQTITKIVRRGFRYGDKLLRPVEAIVSEQE
ncbi:nucleotide exchange factor GrpE [Lusitaniella coriacea LEGE 07157]|uniref:Nucleotide exchange factor GrpE n=1 Tax=Lusitaniella coriacea LEGE 07157 TaxID=945747 RepID=A0A8J7DZY1_9CYAN|nr:nucleotide exchange factor GrpE [Lusitaniella coriacea]MBE9118777.1 nucleotide exchange factor GrpE [Lusitaniella coriacea LEGE 07157]